MSPAIKTCTAAYRMIDDLGQCIDHLLYFCKPWQWEKKGNRFDVPSPWVEQEKEARLYCTDKCSPFEKFSPKILFWYLWNTIDVAANYLHGAFIFKWDATYRKTSYINHASPSRWPLKCELTCIISNRVENGTGTFVLFIKWMHCRLTWENQQRLGHYGAVSASSHHTLVRQMPPDSDPRLGAFVNILEIQQL